MTLWLVRHAQPDIAQGVCYGALDVPALVDATAVAAQSLAAALPRYAQLRCSPLQRCQQLATALCTLRPDLSLETDARLAEMNFGQWEGVPWRDISQAAMAAWTADFGAHRFGGVESANDVLQRVHTAWRDAQSLNKVSAADVVWITHAGVIRAATLIAQGLLQVSDAEQWPREVLGFGAWRCTKLPRF